MARPYELDPSKTSIADEIGDLERNDIEGALRVWRKAQALKRSRKLAESIADVEHQLAMLQDDPEVFELAINE